jgi:hypothetical protein
MATRKLPLKDECSERVVSGDTLILIPPARRQQSYPYNTLSLAVFPAAGSTTVEVTLSPSKKIADNPDDPSINWLPWPNGAITPDSLTKDNQLQANITAIRVKATGGACVVEAKI